MIAKKDTLKSKILDLKYGRVKQGLKIGADTIDEYFRYKQGNFNLIVGHANVGKTTLLIYLLTLYAIKHRLKFLIWSSENTPQSIARKIIEFKMNKPIDLANDKEIDNALAWSNKYFKVINVDDLYTYKDVMKEATEIKDAWDYQGLVVDPYNSLAKDKDLLKIVGGHEYDYQVASELRLFAKKKNITVFLNAHGVTEALRRSHPKGHDYENLPMPLGLASVEGGGKWANRADDVICIHRYTGHPTEWMYTYLHVLKIKENETGGRCTPYEQGIKLRMAKNNVGFELDGQNLLHYKNLKTEF